MDYRELLEKYNRLLSEKRRLINENERLKAQLGIADRTPHENGIAGRTQEKSIRDGEFTDNTLFSGINTRSNSISKIRLFMSLFKGRDDVYARKWDNKKKATSGYSPVCLNQWQVGLCAKPKTSCSKCANQITDHARRTWFDEDPSKGSKDIVMQRFSEKQTILS